MAGKQSAKDILMQFADIAGNTGAASSTLQEQVINTGLSVRGALVWLIHMVEIIYGGNLTTNFRGVDYAVCTRTGLAAMPQIGDHGVLFRGGLFMDMLTSGAGVREKPHRLSFSPPVPIASPQLSVYVQGVANHADGQNKRCDIRMGFTTVPLDSALYTEIAEVWGW